MKKCLLWGTGRDYKILSAIACWKEDVVIIGAVESKKGKEHVQFGEKKIPVYWGGHLKDIEYDVIIIANCFYEEIIELQGELGLDINKMLIPYTTGRCHKYDIIMSLNKFVYNGEEVVNVLSGIHTMRSFMYPMHYDLTEYTLFNDLKVFKDKGFRVLEGDYARVRTLELLISEIKEKKLRGSMAELGVFQGYFAKVMSYYLPEKDLYLYDTFDGFVKEDYEKDLEEGKITAEWLSIFLNTMNIEKIKTYIGNEEKCHYRVGYFPQTVLERDKEEKFCLVSLDVDMYNPILAGLEFFYPRLERGGYILVHEYNCRAIQGNDFLDFSGVKKAVKDFESRHGSINYVPIADRAGTLIITK